MTGVLFCSLSALVTNHAMPTSYVIRRNDFLVSQSAEVRKKCLLRLKYAVVTPEIYSVYMAYENVILIMSETNPTGFTKVEQLQFSTHPTAQRPRGMDMNVHVCHV